MKMKYSALVFLLFIGFGRAANADCNFDRAVGTCEGNVHLVRTGGSAPSFSAELEIGSSAGACSKVDYTVSSIPFTSIIRSSRQEHESLFGSKPLKAADVEVLKCTAYEGGGAPKSAAQEGVADLTGKWFSSYKSKGTDASETLVLVEKNGKLKGKALRKLTSIYEYEGKVYPPVTTETTAKVTGSRKGSKVTIEFDNSGVQIDLTVDGNMLNGKSGDGYKRIE